MYRPRVLQVLLLSVMLVTLPLSTESSFAAVHGGGGGGFHGGGGGFHGGGSAFHGGGSYGGWHGGSGGWNGGSGWHGGGWNGGWHGPYYGGWHGGWGYPWWGGWGFGLSFNFGWPYWGYGYPYAYGYYPYPYYYPYNPYSYYSAPPPAGGGAVYSEPPPESQGSSYQYSAPMQQPEASVPRPAPSSNGLNLFEASYRPPAAVHRPPSATQVSAQNQGANPSTSSGQAPGHSTLSAASYRPAQREVAAMRPEVQNVIRALHGMPPEARQRQIDSGRYSTLSAQELELVRYAAGVN